MVKIWQTPWLLVATPRLDDPHFRRTVVLITEHSTVSSVGFIINRPLNTPLATVIAPDQTTAAMAIPADVPVWEGGPVSRDLGVILTDQSPAGRQLHDRTLLVSLASSAQALAALASAAVTRQAASKDAGDQAAVPALYQHRFLTGYAGWGPGQLMEEVRQGSWRQIPATWDLVFNCAWRSLWDEACCSRGAYEVVTPEQTSRQTLH